MRNKFRTTAHKNRMLPFKISVLNTDEIQDLLNLQTENLKVNLDAKTIDSQGFVSFVYKPETIKGMMELPQIIAKADDTIIGYALSCSLSYGLEMTLMKPLVELSDTLTYQNEPLSNLRLYIIGQVCVKAGYRGQGVFEALYDGHKEYLSNQYDATITEIALENKRSLAAHKRIGFQTIYEYFDEISQKDWAVVLLNLRK